MYLIPIFYAVHQDAYCQLWEHLPFGLLVQSLFLSPPFTPAFFNTCPLTSFLSVNSLMGKNVIYGTSLQILFGGWQDVETN